MAHVCFRCGKRLQEASSGIGFDDECTNILGKGSIKELIEKTKNSGYVHLAHFSELSKVYSSSKRSAKAIIVNIHPEYEYYYDIIGEIKSLGFHWDGVDGIWLRINPTLSDIEDIIYVLQQYPDIYIKTDSLPLKVENNSFVPNKDALSVRYEGDFGLVQIDKTNKEFESLIEECGGYWNPDRKVWMVLKNYVSYLENNYHSGRKNLENFKSLIKKGEKQ